MKTQIGIGFTLAVCNIYMNYKTIKPPIKWVGGKKGLLKQLETYFPKKYNKYFEPFLGGGAVYFHLKPDNAILSDLNPDLILLYETIRTNCDELIKDLRHLHTQYARLGSSEQKALYYSIRKSFNERIESPIKQSAYFIFLNRTAYNGMYRVNSSGSFNVPYGQYKNPQILNADNLKRVSLQLKKAILINKDFEQVIKSAKKGDFVYLDPPYFPVNSTAFFTQYSKENFLKKDQVRLLNVFKTLDKKGVLLMQSNSHTPFIKEGYKNFKQIVVKANRALNCKAKKRGPVKELLILNY